MTQDTTPIKLTLSPAQHLIAMNALVSYRTSKDLEHYNSCNAVLDVLLAAAHKGT